ncbi:MAG: ABC transporter permease [Chloroflexi bacterium]|nr:ABC transporter permease [Chloroflexota bacterium]
MAVADTTVLAQPGAVARFRERVRELRLPWIPIVILSIVPIVALSADVIAPHDPRANDVSIRLTAPLEDLSYPLGTDNLGKDVLSRMIHGTRTILQVTLPAMVVAVVLGTLVGLVSGYAGRWVDSVLMRITDAVLGFPSLLVALLVVSLLGTGLVAVLIAITATTWARFARMIRGEVLSTRERDFVILARISGVSPAMIVWRHLFPNVVNTLMVLTSLTVGQVILLIAALSFLGLGLKPGEPSWGIMVAEGRRVLVTGWWLSLFPGIAITILVMAFNFFGDWLRDYLDPKLRRSR